MELPENILVLIEKYHAGTINAEEKEQLNEWYYSFDDSELELTASEIDSEQQLANRIENKLFENIEQKREVVKMPSRNFKIFAVAASILVLFFSAAFFLFPTGFAKKEIVGNSALIKKLIKSNDVAPGGNKAVLTLANGNTIILDSASNGTISQQGNIKVQKLDNGLLAYTKNGKPINEDDEGFYNTITTPRGGKYQVTLADGTEVWLNAASSIRFPVVFTGDERKVEITGEAYFEVAKDKTRPFKVIAASSEIEVLGTHFNVNAYNDEPSMKTTLLEGLIKIAVPGSVTNEAPKFLKPGQQAGINKAGKITVADNADLDEAIAWKNGRFQFKSTDLNSILRQISRWYDVDVENKGNGNLHFTGQLGRNENVSKVFEQLELTGEIHFKIDGKKIIVR